MADLHKPDFEFSDFSGGIQEREAPKSFLANQWSQLKGLVLDTYSTIRSQWECQTLNVPATMTAVHAFKSGSNNYLVGLTSSGTLYWALAPSDTALYSSVNSSTTWTQLSTGTSVATSGSVAVPANTLYRFICTIPLNASSSGRARNGLLINAVSNGASAIVVYENPSSAGNLICKIYESSDEDSRYASFYLADDKGTVTGVPAQDVIEYAKPGCMPHATGGVMWGDVLCLFGTRWYQSPSDAENYNTVDFDNSSAAENTVGFWTSYVSPTGRVTVDSFHPYLSFNTGFLSPEATITGMQVCDQGLLIFTTNAGSGSGIVLLRGSAYAYKAYPLAQHIGTAETSLANAYAPVLGYWPGSGVAVFVEATGQIWYCDGDKAGRLERDAGPAIEVSAWGDHCCGISEYMLVARGTRLLCLNLTAVDSSSGSFNGAAGWTEFVTPNAGVAVKSMTTIGRSVYFIQSGVIYRYTMAGTRRGQSNGAVLTSTVTTPVLQDSINTRVRWQNGRVQVRGTGTIVSGISYKRSIFSSAPGSPNPTTINRACSGDTPGIAKGSGPSRLASYSFTFTGDVTIDSICVWAEGLTTEKTAAGAG